jgi:predicted transcriptional regulator
MTPEYKTYLKQAAKQRAKVMQAYRRGVPKAEIARKVGVTRQRIQNIIKAEKAK